MTMTDQSTPPAANISGDLSEIESTIDRVRTGAMTETAALELIGRIVERRATPVETYQKPWG